LAKLVPSPSGLSQVRPHRPCPQRALSIGQQRSFTDNHGRSVCLRAVGSARPERSEGASQVRGEAFSTSRLANAGTVADSMGSARADGPDPECPRCPHGTSARTLIGQGVHPPVQGVRPDMMSATSGRLGRSGMDAAQRSCPAVRSAVRSRVRRCQIERSRRQGCRSGSARRAAASFRFSARRAPSGRSVGRSNPHRFQA
jgi:hypothetical protein